MKLTLSSCLFVVLMGAMVVGCGGSEEGRTATDGATEMDIAAYEASVAEAEQQDIDSDMEAEAEAEDPAAVEEPTTVEE